MNSFFTVKPTANLKPQFYSDTAKEVGKALSRFLSSQNKAFIEDDSDFSGSLAVEISLGALDTSGSKDNTPWVEAWSTPLIIKKMKTIGWEMANITVKKKSVSLGFCKKLKKSNFI